MSETMVKKQLEGSEIQTGACRFCGQIYQFETDGRATEEQLDTWAVEKCDCTSAQLERTRRIKAEKAKEKLDKLLGENFEEGKEILYAAIDQIAAHKLNKATLDIGNGIKVSVSVNAKGAIKSEITQTKKRSTEE